MQDNFNTYSLIEDYLNGNLSDEKRIAFEKQLESNPELQTLVDDYYLVDVFIEKNELANINNKLTQIHKTSIRKKNILIGVLGLIILVISIAFYFMIPNNNIHEEEIAINKKTPKSISYSVAESTPFKIIDSMSELKLSSSIQQSKENISSPELIDSMINEEKSKEIIPKETLPIIPKKKDSIVKPFTTKTDLPIKVKSNSLVKITCNITLEEGNLMITSSCSEKSTGSIQFTKTKSNYLYSINSNNNYSSKPYFSSLREGNYLVSLKNKLNNCKSDPIEIIIEGYKCNYIIHPEQFVYLEKSLDKFKDDNSVEIFIFNRNGNLIFNKIIPTSEKFYWEGNSNTNLPTPMGNYTYLIKSGNKVSKGEITIIR